MKYSLNYDSLPLTRFKAAYPPNAMDAMKSRDKWKSVAPHAPVLSLVQKSPKTPYRAIASRDEPAHLFRQSFRQFILSSIMVEITRLAVLYLLWRNSHRRLRARRRRRFWVHATLRRRLELGEFHRLLQELRLDDGRFQRYLRLTVAHLRTC